VLKHQEDPEAAMPPVSAPQARVTPEELSEALAAIEGRKQAEASHLAGTIPIEQAVSELHLDSSPEEIWAEVQAGRAKAKAARQAQIRQEQARQQQAQQQQAQQQQAAPQWVTAPPRPKRRRGLRRIFLPLLGIWTVFHFGIVPSIFSHHPVAVHPVAIHKAQMTSLSQIPDGTEVYADSAALVQLSEGKPLTQVSVDKTQGSNIWTVLKRGGHVYLRGYILQTPSLKAVTGESLNVYNTDNSGELHHEETSAITLRVDDTPLQKSGGDDSSYSEATLPNFQPDPVTTLTPWR